MILSTIGISDSTPTPVEDSYFWYDPGNPESYSGTGTTLFDLSGNGRNSVISGSPTYVSGQGGYFDFDGANDYIRTPNLYNSGNESHTLEVWIRPDALGDVIWSDIGQTGINTAYHFAGAETYTSGGSDLANVGIWNAGIQQARASTTLNLTLGGWIQIVRTYDGSTLRGYSNGELDGSTNTAWDTPWEGGGGNEWFIALGATDSTNLYGGGWFLGQYGTVRFYNRALSEDEIRKNYEATKPLYSYDDPTVESFTATGTTTWTAPAGVQYVEYLVVGGGGGGGNGYDTGGGGGAGGGMVLTGLLNVTPGELYSVTVGSGGAGGAGTRSNNSGSSGNSSSFSSITALGGAGGYGSRSAPSGVGSAGAGQISNTNAPGGGNGGGNAASAVGGAGGGGGGAGGAGTNGSPGVGGAGGAGLSYDISGSNITYSSGGAGARGNAAVTGTNGAVNTGNGGGGGACSSGCGRAGGNGGSGIVIIKYKEPL